MLSPADIKVEVKTLPNSIMIYIDLEFLILIWAW